MKSKSIHYYLALAVVLCASLASLCSSTSLLPNEYSIITENENEVVSDEQVIELFQKWKEAYQKQYRDAAEEEKRLENFKNTLKYVMQMDSAQKNNNNNSRRTMHKVGLNKFADMTNEEFRQVYLCMGKPQAANYNCSLPPAQEEAETCQPPASLDWREKGVLTQVKDQGHCGSCWAFSATGAIESINALNTGELISLSEQELIECENDTSGCCGGYVEKAFAYVKTNGGIDSGEDYPYRSTNGYIGTCNRAKETTEKAVSITGCQNVYPSARAHICAVIQQPISVYMDASPKDFQNYKEGIYNGNCLSDPCQLDHVVLLVGYGSEDGVDYWILKNSWGVDWGMRGYFYLIRNTDEPYGKCGINYRASFPTQETASTLSADKRRLGNHKFGTKYRSKYMAF